MKGWIVPPPTEPTKTPADFERERTAKVNWLVRHGYLKSDRIKAALLKIARENFKKTSDLRGRVRAIAGDLRLVNEQASNDPHWSETHT